MVCMCNLIVDRITATIIETIFLDNNFETLSAGRHRRRKNRFSVCVNRETRTVRVVITKDRIFVRPTPEKRAFKMLKCGQKRTKLHFFMY